MENNSISRDEVLLALGIDPQLEEEERRKLTEELMSAITKYCKNICRYSQAGVTDRCDTCDRGYLSHLVLQYLSEIERQWATLDLKNSTPFHKKPGESERS